MGSGLRDLNISCYWADGNLRYIEEKVPQPFRYTGAYHDEEVNLYNLRARHYSPVLRRFLQRDPILFDGGINLYSYTGCDLVNSGDWKGKIPVIPIIIGAVAGGLGAYFSSGGDIKASIVGTIVGAVVGPSAGYFFSRIPFLEGFISGASGSLMGQFSGNLFSGKPPYKINICAVFGAGIGGIASRPTVLVIRSIRMIKIIRNEAYLRRALVIHEGITEGSFTGLGELALSGYCSCPGDE